MTRHWTAAALALALGPLVSVMHSSPTVRALGHEPSQTPQASPAPQGTAADACAALAGLALPHVTITSATLVAAGAFTPPTPGNAAAPSSARFAKLPAFCRVQATLTPTSDSSIGIEVWLPSAGWNGRFQGVGGRALAGIIVYPAMASALADGYATASTDTGHVGPGGSFAAGHPEKIVDHGHRAVHEMTVTAKQVIDKFYGRPAQKHYWNGCSLGGRQGLAEAQRYPQDYDGIIAGDIANDITGLYAARLQQHQWAHRSAEAALTTEALRTLNTAVVTACDRLDGAADGILENPLQCHFDPATIQCGKPGAPADCLNAEQVETARRMYAPVRRADKSVVSNGLMPGSEVGWTAVLGAEPERNSVEVYRHMVFKDPQWDWKAFQLMPALTAAKTSPT